MKFPSNPAIGDEFSAINGDYVFTGKRAWQRLPVEPSEVSGIPITVSTLPPTGPRLGDQWYNPATDQLFSWATSGEQFFWQLFAGTNVISTALSGAAAVDRLLPLTWAVGEQFAFEMWQDDTRYNWRDFKSVVVTGGTAGDDSLDLVSTEGVQSGQPYVLMNPDGTTFGTVVVTAVVNSTRIRVRAPLATTITGAQRISLARTSFEVVGGFARVQAGDAFYSRWLSALVNYVNGVMYLRRSATGRGVFVVRARPFGADDWTTLKLVDTLAVSTEYRDEQYAVPFGGPVQFDIRYTSSDNTTENVFHFGLLPVKQGVDARRVDTPVAVAPLDNAVNVSTTPTLQGSVFRSIYNLAQNGAEFQVARDEAFKNLVLNTSSDFLASWVSGAAYAAPIESVRYLEPNVFVAASGVNVIALDANSATLRTAALTKTIRALATDGVRVLAVGVDGSIAVSTDKTTYTAYAAGGAFTGELRGAAINGLIALAVGANGEIQRSVNGGVIWAKIGADNNYTGQFEAVRGTSNGYAIAVGAGGEIQTSANGGATWTKRSAAGGYTGTWRDVTFSSNGYAVAVGDRGEIQTSDDFGATWTKRIQANAFAGDFYAVSLLETNAVAVGSTGEIQTSKDRGNTWTRAASANGYSGTWSAAALTPDNLALIGGDGATAGSGVTQRTLNLRVSTTSYTVPAQGFLEVGKIYWWRARYQDVAGFWSEYSKPVVFATKTTLDGVNAPVNLAPASGATDVSQQPTLQTSLFTTTGAADTHKSTTYQIGRSETFAGEPLYVTSTPSELLSFQVPASANLQSDVTYWWRAAHTGEKNGTSPWSVPTSFRVRATSNTGANARELKVLAVREGPPLATDSDSTKNDHFYGRFLVTDFYSAIAGDAYKSTQFQASQDGVGWGPDGSGFANDAIEQINTAFDSNYPSYRQTANNRLSTKGNVFFVRFRHVGTVSGNGPWSTVFKFVVPTSASYGEAIYTTPGTHTFTVPEGITRVCAVVVGGGAAGWNSADGQTINGYAGAGGGGGLTWKNDITVTPGQKISVVVGKGGTTTYTGGGSNTLSSSAIALAAGGTSSFGSVISATGGNVGHPRSNPGFGGSGGTQYGGDGGGRGGQGRSNSPNNTGSQPGNGGGGAAGYTGNGGDGASSNNRRDEFLATAGTGGGGGGGGAVTQFQQTGSYPNGAKGSGGDGGGVGLYGQGANGAGGASNLVVGDGAWAGNGGGGSGAETVPDRNGVGGIGGNHTAGLYGGGGGAGNNSYSSYSDAALAAGNGGGGAVRIIWGADRSFPDKAR